MEVVKDAGERVAGEKMKERIELIWFKLFSAITWSMLFGSLFASKLSCFESIVFLGDCHDVLSEVTVSDSDCGTHKDEAVCVGDCF